MKAGITLLVAMLALAVFTVACKTKEPTTPSPRAITGSASLDLTLDGKSTPKNPTSTVAERKWEHDLAAATANGQSVGTLSGTSQFKRHKKLKDHGTTEIPSDPRCSNAPDSVDPNGKKTKKKWGSDLQKLEWTLTYNDGSKSGTLKGKATNPSDKPVCTDGSEFYVKAEGKIQNGTDDFQGATGTWTGEITKVDRACCTPAAGDPPPPCNTGSCTTTGTLVVNLD